VRAVVHAHPITATGFAVAGLSLDRCTLPEVVITLGSVPLAKYGVPGTDELTQDIMDNYVANHDAFLLANHGVVTIGQSLMNAYYKMETVEHFAKISLVARQLGSENVFSPERAQELIDARERYGVLAGAGCRIEFNNQNADVSYAPEVPRTGAGAAGYAADAVIPGSKGLTNGQSSTSQPGGALELDDSELSAVVREVARRVVERIQTQS
jgi:L-fuculose-phosphate aldolase